MRVALLLVAHGSREAAANADLAQLAATLAAAGTFAIVQESYLELAEPTIRQGAARCVDLGAERVVLVPYFLSAGVHVLRDLTAICTELGRNHPGIPFSLAAPLGRHALLAEIVVQRAREAIQGLAFSPPGP
jgi:sirohydrochlorin ferrochelatase